MIGLALICRCENQRMKSSVEGEERGRTKTLLETYSGEREELHWKDIKNSIRLEESHDDGETELTIEG